MDDRGDLHLAGFLDDRLCDRMVRMLLCSSSEGQYLPFTVSIERLYLDDFWLAECQRPGLIDDCCVYSGKFFYVTSSLDDYALLCGLPHYCNNRQRGPGGDSTRAGNDHDRDR